MIFPEDGLPRVEPFSTLNALLARLRVLDGEEVTVFPFLGFRLSISKPPLRNLVGPWGCTPIALPTDNEVQLEEDGFLGKRWDLPPPPTAADDIPDDEADAALEVDSDEDGDILSELDEDDG